MKGKVRWLEDVSFVAESGSGHEITIDGPPEEGGKNSGMRPMEMVLLGTGGCAAFDVVTILKKSRQEITDCVNELTATRADTVPAVFTSIHMHFIVSGRNLKESQVKRAVDLSAEKYCSASKMLGAAGVNITHDYEIRDS
ncbi:MAG: OsmC family protein [Gammaproteobacteria bacterium]|nr:OsmC family protein [Gammaproteobacteria bacterium]